MLADMADEIARGADTPDRHKASGQIIGDVRNPVARRVADVLRNRSAKPKIFLIDDAENIDQALRSGIRLDSLYVTEGQELPGSIAAATYSSRVPVHVLAVSVAKSLFGGEKRARTFALAHAPQQPPLHELPGRPGDVVVLDGVRVVGNIGAITRTACALGAAGVVLIDSGLKSPLDRRLVRASRGLVFTVPVILATRSEFNAYVQREGLILASLTADATEPLSSIRDVPGRLALVLGGERDGVSTELDSLTSHRYAISMTPDVESLNVSVAAGIALYEHRRI